MTDKISSPWFWRLLHALLPVEQRLNPLLRRFYGTDGWRRVPCGRHWLTIDAAWFRLESSASAPLYRGPQRQNPEFFEILAPCLEVLPPGTIVDVGANIGVYVLDFRHHTDDAIIAFEPDPGMFRLLQETLAFNALPRVSAFNMACGDSNGWLDFRPGINGHVVAGGASEGTPVSVPVVRLDERLAGGRPISLIKIDCEGYEWQVLDGCSNILLSQRPLLFVELHPGLIGAYGHSLEDVCDLLRAHYRLMFWDEPPMRRSRSRVARFLSRYGAGLRRLAGEAEALARARRAPAPDQIFMLALPN